MTDITALLQPIQGCVTRTTLRRLGRIIMAMLAMTGRVTMLGLARWAGPGGSYRSVQRFFYTVLPWGQIFWQFFYHHLWHPQEVYLLAGDESVVSKAGKKTFGLDRFFSSLLQRTVPSLSFFAFPDQRGRTALLSAVGRTDGAQSGGKSSLSRAEGSQKETLCGAPTAARAA